jgi:hypothetical protein
VSLCRPLHGLHGAGALQKKKAGAGRAARLAGFRTDRIQDPSPQLGSGSEQRSLLWARRESALPRHAGALCRCTRAWRTRLGTRAERAQPEGTHLLVAFLGICLLSVPLSDHRLRVGVAAHLPRTRHAECVNEIVEMLVRSTGSLIL